MDRDLDRDLDRGGDTDLDKDSDNVWIGGLETKRNKTLKRHPTIPH